MAKNSRAFGLGRKLWEELEMAQGDSFIPSDAPSWSDEEALVFVKANLPNVRKVKNLFERIASRYHFEDSGND